MAKEKIIIDATNAILGRLLSYAAKQALLGKEIEVINIEKAIILGDENMVAGKIKERRAKGNIFKGPFAPSDPERIAKRGVRGMLNYKQQRGQDAFKRIKFYLSTPKEYEKSEKMKFERYTGGRKHVTLARVCEII